MELPTFPPTPSKMNLPKRILISEPFNTQLDFIEKKLIENQYMPTQYMNSRRKPVTNFSKPYSITQTQLPQWHSSQSFNPFSTSYEPMTPDIWGARSSDASMAVWG